MPYSIIEHHRKGGKPSYSVQNKNTHHLFSKGTTLGKAKAQMRLLYSKETGLASHSKLIKKF